ncbi:MAG: hypothetical protein ACRDRS_08850 [Pseudonocardiaceae bacterium]
MPRYGPVWLEIAREQYASLLAETRGQVDARIEQLLENPRQPHSGYDERTDQCRAPLENGAGQYRAVGAEAAGPFRSPAPARTDDVASHRIHLLP